MKLFSYLLLIPILLPFVISGIGAGIVIAYIVAADGSIQWGEISSFIVMTLVPLFIGFGLLAAIIFSSTGASMDEIRKARSEGRTGTARITAVEPTGTLINDVRVYKVFVVVDSHDHYPYLTMVKKTIDPIHAYKYQPGTNHAVVRLSPDAPDIDFDPEGIATPIPDSTVARAREWGESAFGSSLSGPIQTKKKKRTGRRIRPLGVILVLASWLLAAGITFYIAKDKVGPFFDGTDTQAYEGPAFYEDPDIAEAALHFVTNEYGTDVHEIVLFDDYARVTVRAKDNPDHWDTVTVRGEYYEITNDGAASSQPEEGEYFETDEIDWRLILPDMHEAAIAELPDGDLGEINQHVRVEAVGEHDLSRYYWDDDLPTADYLERYDDETFEFFHDMTKDEARPQIEALIEAAPAAQVYVYLSHDYGNVSLTGNSRGEILEITVD